MSLTLMNLLLPSTFMNIYTFVQRSFICQLPIQKMYSLVHESSIAVQEGSYIFLERRVSDHFILQRFTL